MTVVRPHHLFCILGFHGKGYNKKFVENMENICCKIKNDPNITLILVEGADDICSCCPHMRDSICVKKPDSEIFLKNAEKEIMKILRIDFNDSVEAKRIYNRIKDFDFNDAIFKLCGECEWYTFGYCKSGLENLKKGGFFYEKI
ncbi:MAG TPA: DUF1284 domain-containing protein [bacterium]|nr:DUF1284 domain-containing protein [bacterium]HPO51227.1 DUF1284 domain-containing protein [bacterium]